MMEMLCYSLCSLYMYLILSSANCVFHGPFA